MLFSKTDGCLIETIAPGCCRSDGSPLTDAALEDLGKLLGSTLKEGTVQKVAVVFFMEDEAKRFLDSCKRFGVECRALVMGQEQVLSEGARVTLTNEPRGPLMPLLREESWPHVSSSVHRRLLSFPQNSQVAGPFVTFGWDSPKTVMRVTHELAGDRSAADLEREALENLAKQPYELTEVKPGHVMLGGAEYGAELVLLPKVLSEVQAKVGAKLIAVGLAKEGGFFATNASDLQGVTALMTWTRKSFDEAKGRRISPLPFLAQDGKLIGFVSATQGEDVTAQKKPFWKFW
jgi:hypothetical protein